MKKHIKEFVNLKVVPFVIYVLMRLIWLTCKKRYHHLTDFKGEHFVCACWHSELFISPIYYRKLFKIQKTEAIISHHKDGQIVANTLSYLDVTAIEGSSSKGGVKAFITALKALKNGANVLITPDGPRGPRFTINDGIIALAQKSNLDVFIVNYTASKYWQLRSWDKFVIPKPFATLDLYAHHISLKELQEHDAKVYIKEKMLHYTTI